MRSHPRYHRENYKDKEEFTLNFIWNYPKLINPSSYRTSLWQSQYTYIESSLTWAIKISNRYQFHTWHSFTVIETRIWHNITPFFLLTWSNNIWHARVLSQSIFWQHFHTIILSLTIVFRPTYIIRHKLLEVLQLS